MKIKVLPCFFVIFQMASMVFAQDKAYQTEWSAFWISDEFPQDISNSWIEFQKSFELDENPKNSQLKIAVDSKYWLWVNNKMVVREGGLKRGPTPKDTYYDEVDLTKFLNKGKNEIAVLVWYFGKNGFSHHSSGRSGLLFELSNNKQLAVISDKSWKARIHPAFIPHSDPPHPNFRLPESNIVFDATQDKEWKPELYDNREWHDAYVIGKAGCAPWNDLFLRPIPLWKDFGLSHYKKAPEFPFVSSGDTIKCTLPYNAQLTPYLKIESAAGKRILMLTDNYKGGSEYNLRAEYITKEGVQEYESFGWINGHEMFYIIPEGIKVLDLKYRESGYDTGFSGQFECDDPFFNKLWEKSRRTLYITMRDTYMDCPDRERAQWWGDVVNELGEAFYALSPSSHLLAKKAILELSDWQQEDSILFSPIPAGNWNKELPMQMLNSVGYYGYWTYFMHTGDTTTIKEVYPSVKKYLALWSLDENGLIIGRQGAWSWGDWGENVDMDILYNTWYYLACKSLASMADLLGNEADKAWAAKRMLSIEENFNQHFWREEAYRSPKYKGKTDDRANAMAVLSGLAKPEFYPEIKRVLIENEHASPYMEKYVVEALFMMGEEELALQRLKKRYEKMVNSDLSTLWEGWGLGAEGYGGGTYNHAWSGGGLTLLSQYVAGIEPIETGYKKIRIRPHMKTVKQAKATLHSIIGFIEVENKFITPKKYIQRISAPAQTLLQIYFPVQSEDIKSISVNKKKISNSRLALFKAENSLALKGGNYNIEVELK